LIGAWFSRSTEACPPDRRCDEAIVTSDGRWEKAVAGVVIGVDSHKRTHTLVAADALGRELATKTVSATADGYPAAIVWAARWPDRR
jgi:hypothetical protein